MAVKGNAVEVKYGDAEETLPEVTVIFKDVVKVQSIKDENGKEYTTAAQLEEAKAWLDYKGDLTKFTDTVNLTGTTKTFAEVIAKLGESFQVTVVNEAGESLTLTINLALDVPELVTVEDLGGEGVIEEPFLGILVVKISRTTVEGKFPKITPNDDLQLEIGGEKIMLIFTTDVDNNEFWLSTSIQNITKPTIKDGVITVIKK